MDRGSGGTSPRHREHHITKQDYGVIERDYGSTPSAQDKFKEEMRRMEEEMKRFHEQFHSHHKSPAAGGTSTASYSTSSSSSSCAAGMAGASGMPPAIERPPSFSSMSSSSLAPDRHRTTMDVQLHQPPTATARATDGSGSLLSVVPTFQQTPPPPPRGRPTAAAAGTWKNYFDNNPDSSLIEHTHDGKQLRLRFDVGNYKPEEVSVKTTGNRLKVSAKHEDDGDGSKNFREFSKEFQLPDNIDPELLKSSLSKDGVLTVEAPLPEFSNDVPPRDY